MPNAKNPSSKISRREFMMLVGTGAPVMAGVGFFAAKTARRPREQLVPYLVPPEDYIPGVAVHYNTVCNLCAAGCGIRVRAREGRAKKIEGNPLHPVSRGGTCALGQAGVQVLYNPDRLTRPRMRRGERGAGNFRDVTWDNALSAIAYALQNLRLANRGADVGLLTGDLRGHLDELYIQFLGLMGSGRYLQHSLVHPATLYAANQAAFGTAEMPYYDIAGSDLVISFGADPLGMWNSPVHYSQAYGEMRQGTGTRGRLIQVEPRMSLTGANADEWVPAAPGTEGAVALGVAHVLAGGRGRFADALAGYDPAAVEAISGVEARRIEHLAAALDDARTPLALGGGGAAATTNGVSNMLAVNLLNHLLGSVGRTGGVIFNPPAAFGRTAPQRHGSYRDVLEFVEQIADSENGVLIIHGANPVFDFPSDARLRRALQRVPMVVGLSCFMDETMQYADLVLPVHSFLEDWSDDTPEPGVGFPVASLGQPVVAPLYDTRSPGDILLDVAHRMDNDMRRAMPWPDFREYLRAQWQRIYRERRDRMEFTSFEDFWEAVVQAGVWGEERRAPQPTAFRASVEFEPPRFAGDAGDYPFHLHPFFTQAFLDGRGANLPWQQEMPDPMTSIVYGSWIELNPRTARDLGVGEGDVVEVSSPAGTVRAPVWVTQGIRPDTVAMPIGQGHTSYGRYATDRGVNPLKILAPETDASTGALALAATRVRLTPTGERIRFVKTGGVNRTLGRQILRPPEEPAVPVDHHAAVTVKLENGKA